MPQPIKVYNSLGGPNPFKVIMILEELGLQYDNVTIHYANLKKEPFTKINPNGRVPAIEDPNTNLTIWESGAIVEYLIETYDKDHKISHEGFSEKWQERQWLYFQATGQGPYWGQAAWFNCYHPEKLPSAQERYMKELNRTVQVLNDHLSSRADTSGPHPVLVGSKVTYADISFVPWTQSLPVIFEKFSDQWDEGKYPYYKQWMEGLKKRPAVQEAIRQQADILTRFKNGEFKNPS